MEISANYSRPAPERAPATPARDYTKGERHQSKAAHLSFAYESEAKLYVKRRIDPQTSEVLDQFPSAAFVDARAQLRLVAGSIIDLIA